MDDAVRHLEISPRIVVDRAVEVHAVVRERVAKTVVPEEHRGNAVEAIAVETVLVEPEAAVREKEMENVGLAVVEAAAVPGAMPALPT